MASVATVNLLYLAHESQLHEIVPIPIPDTNAFPCLSMSSHPNTTDDDTQDTIPRFDLIYYAHAIPTRSNANPPPTPALPEDSVRF